VLWYKLVTIVTAVDHESAAARPIVAGQHAEPVVIPGEVGTFRFLTMEVPATAPPEHFQFVVEHVCWLPNTEIGWSASEVA
jgi:hypothetical protein